MGFTRQDMMEMARSRDRAYNGRFLIGVVTTGIYCLPSCPSRKARPENVRFFRTEAEAQASGLRACLRCRPDDFYRDHDDDLDLVEEVARRMRHAPAAFADLDAVVRVAGVGASKLHALFRTHYHTTPAAYLQRQRVAAACRALLESERRILDVALDAGFDSSSAFHANFRSATGLTPGDYRRLVSKREFVLELPRGYRSAEILRILGRDPESACERVRGNHVAKAILVRGVPVVLHVELGPGSARCRVEPGGALEVGGMADAHAAAVRLLGLRTDPTPFERRLARLDGLGKLVRGRRGLRIPLTASVFEALVWVVVGQQVNLPFASTLRRRVVELCGREAPDGLRCHPDPADVAGLEYGDLVPLQFSRRKAEYLVDLARTIASGNLDVEVLPEQPATRVAKRLGAVRGLGPWSVQYVLMRGCGFEDCVPAGDSGLAASLERFFDLDHRPDARETVALLEPFAPHRSLATFHLWMKLADPA
jgi:AraC family transcriptional regulator of adaptative response / DNA-3-methyladenine glycosylase II